MKYAKGVKSKSIDNEQVSEACRLVMKTVRPLCQESNEL